MKKSSESSQRARQPKGKRSSSKKSASSEIPELTAKQLAAFRPVSRKRHQELKKAVAEHRGRPRKAPEEKENVVSIRFSKSFLDKLKAKAQEEGYSAWQTYAKDVLGEKIGIK